MRTGRTAASLEAPRGSLFVLKDVVNSLQAYGMGPFKAVETVQGIRDGRKTTVPTKATKRSTIFQVVMYILLIRMLLRLIMVFFGKGKLGESVVEFLRTMAATYSYSRVTAYRPRICHLFWSLDRHLPDTLIEREPFILSPERTWKPAVYVAAIMDASIRRLQHANLCVVVKDMDDVFSPLAFLWHAMMLLGNCGEVTHLIQIDLRADALVTSQIFLDMLYLMICFTEISLSAAAVSRSHCNSLPEVNSMTAVYCTNGPQEDEFLEQAFLLMSMMRTGGVSLTAWKFYELNRAAFMTTTSAVATYIAVVLQLAPSFVGSKE
ncbi:hypothetical protein HPB50_004638 [Hyalomma asiaticum]|uniref:Uncharacterized protein n=1 Tax=Hyalomma asiaticum TaxID=266040 RepID=A0ACB7SE20_HYAAI|nr:hypothetical protein HPB50_004638 [Hyalomma asiaticum]